MKHSGVGIAAFVISIVVGVLEFFLTLLAGYMEMSTPGGISETDPMAAVLGLLLLGGLLLAFVGVGLGIGTLFQKDKKKIFGILGLIFSSVILLGMGGLMLLGSAAA